jgi:ATP-dependent protease Clp ATPase subunit
MAARTVKTRTRFFLAVEGESEQSLVRWLQMLSDENGLSVHLDSYVLGGGGYKSMLENAIHEHQKRVRSKGAYRDRFLIVDGDRANTQDWPLDKLREEAAKHGFIVIVQSPNHEGLLYRMTPGKELDIPSASTAQTKLRTFWPTYQKPANAYMLNSHFTLPDLARLAGVDPDLDNLLRRIGLL